MNAQTPTPAHPAADAARQRLERLENYLRQDPANQHLLIDAFETALACGDWARAQFHLAHGLALGVDSLGWRLREGDFWLAQQSHDKAREVLQALQAEPSPPPRFREVLAHNLGFIDLAQGRHADGVARLAPWMDAAPAAVPDESPARALSALWLRLLHHDGQHERAIAWAQQREAAGALDVQSTAIASLIAIDAGQFSLAERWAAQALREGGPERAPIEALVSAGSLALARQDVDAARRWSLAALARQPGAGRAASNLGFTELLAGRLDAARAAFERATTHMPAHIGTWHGRGWAELLHGQPEAAQASFEAALALDRNFAESHGGLAVVLAVRGQQAAAREHIALSLRLDPANLGGRYAQALLDGEVKDTRELQRLARRLLGGRAAPLGGDLGEMLGGGEGDGPA